MRVFGVLLKKELRELLTPLVLVPLVLTMGIFWGIGKLGSAETERLSASRAAVTVIDRDGSTESQAVRDALAAAGLDVRLEPATTQDAAGLRASYESLGVALVIVPEGFGSFVTAGEPAQVERYAILRSLSMRATGEVERVDAALAVMNAQLSSALIASQSPLDPEIAKAPVRVMEHVVVGSRSAAVSLAAVGARVQEQTFFIPLILFVVIMFASQLIATSIASEKENKTLETLLSTPVSRQAIVGAKLVAAGLLALGFALVYMVGFHSYVEGLSGGAVGGGAVAELPAFAELGLNFTPSAFAVLGATLFLGILIALSLALILGAFAEDVKGIQAVITPLMVMLIIPYFLVMFFDVSALSPAARWLVYAIPFSHSFLAPQAIIFRDFSAIGWGMLYQFVVLVALITLASRIFSSDAIVTMKLNLKKAQPRFFGRR
ncbi:MAG: ABC transporter permease [Patescibacteria group bacterium]|jgi:ABC-2 type transport system permease protein